MDITEPFAVANHPRFRELVKRRTRFTLGLSACVLLAYYGFMMVVAFKPGLLRTPLGEGLITMAWPEGTFVILFSWLLAGWYCLCQSRRRHRPQGQGPCARASLCPSTDGR
ncbi:DUF485 domain-containing protein [Ralstonia sp.]|uniref:DUF485 domain-containing protein n=1 Tax=Burkholderiales TaxID=80840 RepID=UPI00257EAF34|nr:DUF485 domain-containing protein [Ralstonia sp.]MBA4279613.1 hypothetical protein [Ralstonia sp.]